MKTSNSSGSIAYHRSTVVRPAATRHVHRSLPMPHTRLPNSRSDPHRLRKQLRRLRQPEQFQDVCLYRIQTGKTALDHTSADLFDLHQAVVGKRSEERRVGKESRTRWAANEQKKEKGAVYKKRDDA